MEELAAKMTVDSALLSAVMIQGPGSHLVRHAIRLRREFHASCVVCCVSVMAMAPQDMTRLCVGDVPHDASCVSLVIFAAQRPLTCRGALHRCVSRDPGRVATQRHRLAEGRSARCLPCGPNPSLSRADRRSVIADALFRSGSPR